jgi:hypothetical protein
MKLYTTIDTNIDVAPSKTFVRRTFYSEEGIFTIDSNNIYKVTVIDVPIIHKQIGKYPIQEDNSYTTREQVYQLPVDAVESNTNVSQWSQYSMVSEDGQVHFESERGLNMFISLINKC